MSDLEKKDETVKKTEGDETNDIQGEKEEEVAKA